ncbi:MAG: hypothetical protein AAF432_01900 [Planctomycetota bacterium]
MSEHAARIIAGIVLACTAFFAVIHLAPSMQNAAVAVAEVSAADPDAEFRHHVQRLWDARRDRDWAITFEYQHDMNIAGGSVEEYVQWADENEPFIVQDYELLDIAIDGEFAWAQIASQDSIRRFEHLPPRNSERWEKWYRDADGWRPVPGQLDESYPTAPVYRIREFEPALRQRFVQAWTAQQRSDWASFEDVLEPADRDKLDAESFESATTAMNLIGCDVKWVQAIGNAGKVHFEVEFKINDPSLTKLPSQKRDITEEWWVRIDGQWYIDLDRGSANS